MGTSALLREELCLTDLLITRRPFKQTYGGLDTCPQPAKHQGSIFVWSRSSPQTLGCKATIPTQVDYSISSKNLKQDFKYKAFKFLA